MKPTISLLALVLTWNAASTTGRAEPPAPLFDGCKWSFPGLCQLWAGRKCWCPDDYARKTMPCVTPNAKGCVDDYSPKPFTCPVAVAPGCVDDYCRKTCPIHLGSNCEPWYICGPPDACSSCGPGKPAR
jgi:hypothetical protein